MSTPLLILSKLCFAWIVIYAIVSIRSGMWAGARHSRGLVLLEFQPYRARGSREIARARLLKKMALLAVLALPIGIVSFIASAILS